MSWGIGTDSCKYKGAFNDHGQFHGKGTILIMEVSSVNQKEPMTGRS